MILVAENWNNYIRAVNISDSTVITLCPTSYPVSMNFICQRGSCYNLFLANGFLYISERNAIRRVSVIESAVDRNTATVTSVASGERQSIKFLTVLHRLFSLL